MIKLPCLPGWNDPAAKVLLLTFIEKQINHALRSDPVTLKMLGKLDGSVIESCFTESAPDGNKSSCFIYPTYDGLYLSAVYDGEVDAWVEGSAVAWGMLAIQKDRGIADIEGLRYGGDIDLLARMDDIRQLFEFDWEALFCQCLGDVSGHLLAEGIRAFSGQVQSLASNMTDNLGEYLQEELRLLPSRQEMDLFASDIAEISADADQLSQLLSSKS
ncbi:hypothetical protein CI610_02959 [invertebrate metagenome]|uniref:Ubiquinone biosynthesis accessory factor UbiJ n=1 Tax=invertebrate metagenome TaxID=1711999 RepID=A0A2H9T4H5_9ZZZZ